MKTRVISGVIGAVVLIAVLLFNSIVFNIAVTAVSFIAVCELLRACGINRKPPLLLTGIIMNVCLTITFIVKVTPVTVICIFMGVFFVEFMTHRPDYKYSDIAKTLFSVLYVSLFLGHLISIRAMGNGKFLIWIVILCAFLTDIFAMLGGSMFGKHKLCPVLSPKKTVEGAISGVVGSLLGMVVYGIVLKSFFGFEPNFIAIVVLAIVTSVVAQLGDLSASSIKREYNIKDYGNIMPGHGGAMDRFDSIMFVAPFVYMILSILPVI